MSVIESVPVLVFGFEPGPRSGQGDVTVHVSVCVVISRSRRVTDCDHMEQNFNPFDQIS